MRHTVCKDVESKIVCQLWKKYSRMSTTCIKFKCPYNPGCFCTVFIKSTWKQNHHDLHLDCNTHFMSCKKIEDMTSSSHLTRSEIKRSTAPIRVYSTPRHVIRDLQTCSFEHWPVNFLYSLMFPNDISVNETSDFGVRSCTGKVNSCGSA